MKKFLSQSILGIILLGSLIFSCQQSSNQESILHKGYVLKPGEGEIITFEDGFVTIKASTKSGTQGSTMVYDEMPPNATSGIHYHLGTDEFFYVLEGDGKILIGQEETDIHQGYFVFVPVGEDHRITSSSEDPVKVIYFVDKPGLAEQFREEAHLKLDRTKMTVDEFNEIVIKYGSVYKTFD